MVRGSHAHFAGTREIGPDEGIDLRTLEEWLCLNLPGFSAPLTVEAFRGGQSNPTYRITGGDLEYVLRRKPAGDLLPGAHAIEREFRILEALAGMGFPVPQPRVLCLDEGIMGTRFFIMELVRGRGFWDPTMPGIEPRERTAMFDSMNQVIADLHRLDFEAHGLADYGRSGNYFARQIHRWSKQYVDDPAAGRDPHMDMLVQWLPKNIPAEQSSSIVHGDFRVDNLIFHPIESRVVAVLDWELSTLGHPLADFAFHLMMYRLPPHIIGGFAGANLAVLGVPSEEEYIAAYCRRTGREGIDHLDFYLAFNMFRFAAIFHGIKGRLVRGTASSKHAGAMAANLPELAALAWSLAGVNNAATV